MESRLRVLCAWAAGLSAAAPGSRALAGGQFELGPGRLQSQLLAAPFHPDAPNDLAPVAYHDAAIGQG